VNEGSSSALKEVPSSDCAEKRHVMMEELSHDALRGCASILFDRTLSVMSDTFAGTNLHHDPVGEEMDHIACVVGRKRLKPFYAR
jgi:hypothetical protein